LGETSLPVWTSDRSDRDCPTVHTGSADSAAPNQTPPAAMGQPDRATEWVSTILMVQVWPRRSVPASWNLRVRGRKNTEDMGGKGRRKKGFSPKGLRLKVSQIQKVRESMMVT
jgi:hypothetical protein